MTRLRVFFSSPSRKTTPSIALLMSFEPLSRRHSLAAARANGQTMVSVAFRDPRPLAGSVRRREIIESKEHAGLFAEALAGFRILRIVEGNKRVKRFQGRRLGGGQVARVNLILGRGRRGFGKLVQDAGCFVDPASLGARRGIFPQPRRPRSPVHRLRPRRRRVSSILGP